MTREERQKCIKIAYDRVKEFRQMWELPNEPIKDISSLVVAKEFLLLRFPNIFGIAGIHLQKKDGDKLIHCIYIDNADPIGRQNFTLAHEIYHAYFEPSTKGVCMQTNKHDDPIETKADNFASYLLIPRDKLAQSLFVLFTGKSKKYRNISLEQLLKIQERFQVSLQAIVYAIDELCNFPDYNSLIPSNINAFKKYYMPQYWEELMIKSEMNNCYLNTPNPIYEFPENFKSNLIKNYKNGKIQQEDIEEIFDFFDTQIDSSLEV